MDFWAIDRFEDDYAVLTLGQNTVYFRRDQLPDGAGEGSILRFEEHGPVLCPGEEERIRSSNRARLDKLLGRD